MELTWRQIGSVLVLSFAEPLSLEGDESTRFKERLKELIDKGRNSLVIDLDLVEFIDSSGLGALISSLKMLRMKGGDVKLCSLSQAVRSVFEITKLLRVFDVYPTAAQALESMQNVSAEASA